MTARTRGGHFARGRKYKGREAGWQRKVAETKKRSDANYEREAREAAVTDAQRAIRAEQKRHRETLAADREHTAEEQRRHAARQIELQRELDDRERELSEYAGLAVMIPRPEPARQIRRKPDDRAVTWSKSARSPERRSLAEIRKLNGLD